MRINPGSTDVSLYFKLTDPSTGAPETGLTLTSLTVNYVRDIAVRVGASATALAAATTAHTDNGMFEVDSTNCPGLYRADFPDAAFASGKDKVQCVINGSAIDPAVIEVELNYNLGTSSDMADAVAAKVLTEPTNLSDKSLGAMIYHGFSRMFHKVTQTETTQIVYKDDGTTALGTMPVSDDFTTQTKGEASEN